MAHTGVQFKCSPTYATADACTLALATTIPNTTAGEASGREAVYDRHVLGLDVAGLAQTLAECSQTIGKHLRRTSAKKSNHRHRRLLRACRKRQRRRAAKQRD